MKISVKCPICGDVVTCTFDGTLWGILAISDLAIMELTAPAEVTRHVDGHRVLNEAGTGFEMDPRYWTQLRRSLEAQRDGITGRLRGLDDICLRPV